MIEIIEIFCELVKKEGGLHTKKDNKKMSFSHFFLLWIVNACGSLATGEPVAPRETFLFFLGSLS